MHNNVFLANFEAMEKNEIIIPDTYRSISGESEGLFKDNGSRFIAKAYPVESEEEVKMIVGSLKRSTMTPGIIVMRTVSAIAEMCSGPMMTGSRLLLRDSDSRTD